MRYEIKNVASINAGGKVFKAVNGLFELTHSEFVMLSPFKPVIALEALVEELKVEVKPEGKKVKKSA